MEKTWASGAVELLRHADSHIDLATAFDKRIAFISVDNCVETCVRSFLSMPQSKSGIKVSKSQLDEALNSFPKLIELLYANVPNAVTGIDAGDVEHYHRIRNTLYHSGTGLSVDDQYLHAYRSIAVLLLANLFDVVHVRKNELPLRLDSLILNWSRIDKLVRDRLAAAGVDYSHTYKWEMAFQAGVLNMKLVEELTDVRMARNRLAHSIEVDPKDVAYWVEKSSLLLEKLTAGTDSRGGV